MNSSSFISVVVGYSGPLELYFLFFVDFEDLELRAVFRGWVMTSKPSSFMFCSVGRVIGIENMSSSKFRGLKDSSSSGLRRVVLFYLRIWKTGLEALFWVWFRVVAVIVELLNALLSVVDIFFGFCLF